MYRRHSFLFLVPVLVLSSACASISDKDSAKSVNGLTEPSTTIAPTTTTTKPRPCVDATASLRPPAPSPAPSVDAIRARGYLNVGVDQNTRGFEDRNAETGDIEGFEIDLVHEIAQAIFGDPDPSRVKLVAVSTAQRIDYIKAGTVDLVVSLLTATCKRFQDVDFSSVYYEAHQALLVRTGSGVRSGADVAGKPVCATAGSTSLDNIVRTYHAKPYPVANRIDCLVALQEGKVDAITSDDTVLAGFHAQDPDNTRILSDVLEQEPYAIGIAIDHRDLVRFVNGVLEALRADGRLEASRQKWVVPLGVDDALPQPNYQD
jgi:polar amino acid transport system substrate-binding protein